MPGRQFNSSSYKYGFNGKEKDDEINGGGNSYDFGARMYDSRLGRWLSLDPLQTKYPDLSPYSFVDNNPIYLIDPDGKRIIIHSYNAQGVKQRAVEYKNGKLYHLDGTAYKGTDKYILRVKTALDNLKKMDERVGEVVGDLEASKNTHIISNKDTKSNEKHEKYNQKANYNRQDGEGTYTKADLENKPKGNHSDEDIVGHELKHGWNKEIGISNAQKSEISGNGKTTCEEVDVMNFENIIRDKEYKLPRTSHGKDEGEIQKQDLIPANKYKLNEKLKVSDK